MTEKLPLLYQMREKLTGAVYGTFHLERHPFDSKPDPYGFRIIYQRPAPSTLGMGVELKGEVSWACLMLRLDNQKESLRLNPELTAELLAQRPYEEVYFFLKHTLPPDHDGWEPSFEQIAQDGNFLESMERAYRVKKDKSGHLGLIPQSRYQTAEERAKLIDAVGSDYGRFVLEYETGDSYWACHYNSAITAFDHDSETGQSKLMYLAVQFGEEKPVRLNKQQIGQLLDQRPNHELKAILEIHDFRPAEESGACLGMMKYAYRVKRHKNKVLQLIPLWQYGVYDEKVSNFPRRVHPYRLKKADLSFRVLSLLERNLCQPTKPVI